jgi:thiamine-phosphate pyrophosphorylase
LNPALGHGTLDRMDEFLSPSAQRAIEAAQVCCRLLGGAQVAPVHLLLGVALQEESRGATMLGEHGVQTTALRDGLGLPHELPAPSRSRRDAIPHSGAVQDVIKNVRDRAVRRGPGNPAGTDVLLVELLSAAPELWDLLAAHGADTTALGGVLKDESYAEQAPIAPEFDSLDVPDAVEHSNLYRVLDAAANRAREGLRVLEDYARFACDDPLLTAELKAVRHQLKEALDRLPRAELLGSRETTLDVGTRLKTDAEWARTNTLDVVAANFKRVQEALRSLEEYGKVESRPLAEVIESARYRLYTLERVALIGADSRAQLNGVVLYVLVTGDRCRAGREWTIREAVGGGAQVVQLREKGIADRELLDLAQRVRRITSDADALFIMNDRPDIARLAGADGVHLGQEELSVKDARRIMGPRAIVGVSTHSIEQAREAVLDGANYIGVGPVFPSRTKDFSEFPGLELVRQVHAELRLPTFAIGGIDLDNMDEVIDAGSQRVAVSSAICDSDDPRLMAAEFRRRLEAGQGG